MNQKKFFQVLCLLPEVEINAYVSVTFESLLDLTEVEHFRSQYYKEKGVKLTYNSIVIKALAQTLKEKPYANGRVYRWPFFSFLGPQRQEFNTCDIAVAIERHMPGLESFAYVDIVRSAENKKLHEIRSELKFLADSTTDNNQQLQAFTKLVDRFPVWLSIILLTLPKYFPKMWSQYRGAAALVSSPAKYGVDSIGASWAWPLGVSYGFVKERALVVNGELSCRPSFNLIMNFDRRIMAGAQAAQFFKSLCEKIENPQSLCR